MHSIRNLGIDGRQRYGINILALLEDLLLLVLLLFFYCSRSHKLYALEGPLSGDRFC